MNLDTVHHADCFDLMAQLDDASIDLIAVDPPYRGVKDEAWDNQWPTVAAYLEWIGGLLEQFRRILKPNGSLYLFASPQMAARVEVKVSEYFNVLNRITWQKPAFSTKAEMFDKDTMRGYFPASEAIVFAEQGGADTIADAIAGFSQAETALKKRLFGDYLESERERANITRRPFAELFPSDTGGLTGCYRNWVLGLNIPTPDQYQKMRDYLNNLNGHADYLRREYEDLRREYEDLRRPFNVTAQDAYTDVWTFRTVNAYPGKHPCEKPLDLMNHIVKTSSKPGAVVLDCFCGSGATLDAARRLGRHYVGCDSDPHWVAYAQRRVSLPFMRPLFNLELDDTPTRVPETQLPLFAHPTQPTNGDGAQGVSSENGE